MLYLFDIGRNGSCRGLVKNCVRIKLGFMEIDFLWKMECINNLVCPATSALTYISFQISV